MAIYQLRCDEGHSFEVIQSFSAPLPACPSCGGGTRKVPCRFGVGGRGSASLPPPPEAMPQTWRGTYEGNREYVTALRRAAEQRQVIEERHPELAGDRRPVLAHEGRFEAAPLRAGDPLPAGRTPGHQPEPGHSHEPGPSHEPGHSHGQLSPPG